ncbi:MAG: hypothetical protein IKE94_07390 [Aeriscardovia sp.]|nr:hypothetical protein [Aeriscardovia sp.]
MIESMTLILVALAPSIGALISIIMMVVGIIKEFKQLRADVRDDKTVNEILKNNKHLNAQYQSILGEVDKLKAELEKVVSSNELTSARMKNLDQDISELSRKLDNFDREV